MPLDFPSNPTNGQIYGNYYYDTSSLSWRSSPLTNGPAYISDTIPSGAPNGGMWYNSTDGTLFIKYADSWVEARSNPKIIPGSIIQVQTSQLTSRVSQSVGASSDGSSFLSVSITPKLINSKFIIQFFVNGSSGDTARYQNFGISTYRSGTKIGQGDIYGSTTRVTSSFWGTNTDSAATSMISGNVIDVPNTLSAITYDIRPVNVRGDSSSTIFINGGSRTDGWMSSGISTLTIWEVAQ